MLNSRDVNLLRPDVATNCRVFLGLCKAEGLNVLVVNTVRDDEYQLQCYKNGTGGKPPATFHAVKAGLAFDICKNVKGHEYDDPEFFRRCGAIGQRVGFEWGGGWSSFVDRPHFQWSARGKWKGSDIRRGKYPPQMPLYEEEKVMEKPQTNREIVKNRFGLDDTTLNFLEAYKYGDALLEKLAAGK